SPACGSVWVRWQPATSSGPSYAHCCPSWPSSSFPGTAEAGNPASRQPDRLRASTRTRANNHPRRRIGGMAAVSEEKVREALSTVNDPEIKKPITELGMVDDIQIDGGRVRVRILLTIAGCPLKEQLTREPKEAVGKIPGVDEVEVELGVMSEEQRQQLREELRRGQTEREIPLAKPDSLTKVCAVASGKGGVGKSSVTVNLAAAMAAQGMKVGVLDADIYGHSVPDMLGIGDARPTQVEDMIMPVPVRGLKVISVGMLKPRKDQVVAWRGPMLDRALVQMLSDVFWGDLDALLLDLPPGTGDIAISLGQHLT